MEITVTKAVVDIAIKAIMDTALTESTMDIVDIADITVLIAIARTIQLSRASQTSRA
jgi:hypothetical protein